ncbi:hypothetical protein EON67_07535 [archaeon]|nr:MAG: hypothetical protein EON67_07535 [archaeon]
MQRVLRHVMRLRDAPDAAVTATPMELGYDKVREVVECDPPTLLSSIEGVFLGVVSSILSSAGFSYSVPSRAASNQQYIAQLDRIVLGDKVRARLRVRVRVLCGTAHAIRCLRDPSAWPSATACRWRCGRLRTWEARARWPS